ncbi:MAG TPA: TlpA disulfide reductase family protein [Abditibacterium sp.]
MPKLRHFLALSLLASTAPIAYAQPNIAPPAPKVVPAPLPKEPLIEPAARALVEALAARYKAMKSYSDVTKLTGFAGNFEAKIQWERPNRARVEAKIGGKTGFGLNDGKTLWALNPEHLGFYVKRAGDTDRIFDALHEANIGAPGFMLNPGDKRENVMENFIRDGLTHLEMGLPEELDGAPMQTVRATFAFNDGNDSLMTLFIGKEGLMHQLTMSSTGMGSITETHRDIQIDPILPPETWQWTPPENLKAIDYFSQLQPNRFKPAFAVGQKLPDFKALDLEEKPLSLTALKGRAVVLYFFSINSGIYDVAQLNELQKQFGTEKLAIVGVSMDGRRERVAEWAKAQKISFPIAFDAAGSRNPVATAYGVRSWSTTFLIDAQGVLRSINRRPSEPDFDEQLRALLP